MRDSLSRCEADNPYSWKPPIPAKIQDSDSKNPSQPYSAPLARNKRQQADDHETEIIQRLTDTLPRKSLFFVAKCGKYIFLALLIPPHVLFIRIPKWCLIHVVPHLVTTIRQIIERGNKGMRALFLFLTNRGRKGKQGVFFVTTKVKVFFFPIFHFFAHFFETGQNLVLRQRERMRKMFIAIGLWIRQASSFLQKGIRRVISSPQKLKKAFSHALKIFSEWKNSFFVLSKYFLDWQHRCLRVLFKKSIIPFLQVREKFSSMVQHVRSWIRRRVERVKSIQEWFKWLRAGIHSIKKTMTHALQGWKPIMDTGWREVKAHIAQLTQQMITWIPSLPKTLPKFSLLSIFLQKIRESISKRKNGVYNLFQKRGREVRSIYSNILARSERMAFSLGSFFYAIFLYCKKKISPFFVRMRRWIAFLFYAIRWSFTKLSQGSGFLAHSFFSLCRLIFHLLSLSWHMAKQML